MPSVKLAAAVELGEGAARTEATPRGSGGRYSAYAATMMAAASSSLTVAAPTTIALSGHTVQEGAPAPLVGASSPAQVVHDTGTEAFALTWIA